MKAVSAVSSNLPSCVYLIWKMFLLNCLYLFIWSVKLKLLLDIVMKVGKAGGEKWKSMSTAVSSQYHVKLLVLVGMFMDDELCQPLLDGCL